MRSYTARGLFANLSESVFALCVTAPHTHKRDRLPTRNPMSQSPHKRILGHYRWVSAELCFLEYGVTDYPSVWLILCELK